jgi:predicted MFS family arabinose efflux permease
VRPVRRAFAGTLTARAAQTMIPLTLLLVFRQRTGSFGAAGLAVAVFSLASVAGSPVIARLADRRGPLVLAVAGTVNAVSLVLLAVTTAPAASWIAVAAAGASVPPLTSALRATITAELTTDRDRAAAFSVDAIATELLFVAGPALVSAAAALDGTADAFLVAAALVVTGAALITSAAGRGARRPAPAPAAPRPAASLAPWLAVSAAQMAGIAFVEVAAAARVIELGSPAAAGTVLAVWAAGSVAGGLVYGSRDWPGSPSGQLRVLLLLLGTGLAVVAVARSLMVLYPLMFAAGIACAPAATALTTSFGRRANRAESFAWLASSAGLGGSAGYAAAGLLLAHATITATILAGAALPAAAVAMVPRSAAPRRARTPTPAATRPS